jgi:hypothetical protein
VELKEHGDDDEESSLDDGANGADEEVEVEGLSGLHDGDDLLHEEGYFAGEAEDEGGDDVEEEEHEELAVGEAHAVGDPGTMVVHVEHAALAGRAVMAPKSAGSTSPA